MKIHTCKSCGAKSDTSKFYAGFSQLCAECHKSNVRANRAAKTDYYRKYDAMRFQSDARVKDRHKAYQKTEAGRAAMTASRIKWAVNNAEKRAAHIILGNRVKSGSIKKPSECENCGQSHSKIHGHHHDYSKPLDVKWLCPKCHTAEHKKART
jgi:ribosomal protein S27AE